MSEIMISEYRAFEVDFEESDSDGVILCSLFTGYRPDGMPLHPEVDELVALYDETLEVWGRVIWASGGQVEIQILVDGVQP